MNPPPIEQIADQILGRERTNAWLREVSGARAATIMDDIRRTFLFDRLESTMYAIKPAPSTLSLGSSPLASVWGLLPQHLKALAIAIVGEACRPIPLAILPIPRASAWTNSIDGIHELVILSARLCRALVYIVEQFRILELPIHPRHAPDGAARREALRRLQNGLDYVRGVSSVSFDGADFDIEPSQELMLHAFVRTIMMQIVTHEYVHATRGHRRRVAESSILKRAETIRDCELEADRLAVLATCQYVQRNVMDNEVRFAGIVSMYFGILHLIEKAVLDDEREAVVPATERLSAVSTVWTSPEAQAESKRIMTVFERNLCELVELRG